MLPALKNNEINLFLLNSPIEIDQQLQANCFKQLSHIEQQKQQRFYFKQDQNLYLMAHAMIRMVLAEYIGCSAQALVFVENKYGKPALRDHPNIRFNLSHSKNRAALAVCCSDDMDLGVDVECALGRDDVIDLATHYFSTDEAAWLLQQPESRQKNDFFQLWTLKESYIKAIGKGLSIDLNSFSFSSINQDITIKHHSHEEHQYDWRFYCAKPFNGYHLSIAIRNLQKGHKRPIINVYEYLPTLLCKQLHLNFVTSPQV